MKAKDFAVVSIKSSQEMVSEGDIISVDKLEGEAGSKITFEEVLLTNIAGKIEIGKPNVKGIKVEAEIVEQTKADKVHTRNFKAKSRYRKHTGDRKKLTKIKIVSIK
ncbi:50S ribosomal protein L21 [Candidatus Dojkabacteria bacterium]|nr:50S ribosomal protein L21 [Candidatus Dojkabacteria bacterium]